MIYQTNNRELSLLEQKKLQWAREKEEMSRLNEMFSSLTTTRQIERTSIRTYYSNTDLTTSNSTSTTNNNIPVDGDNCSSHSNYYSPAMHRRSSTNGNEAGFYYHQHHQYDNLRQKRIRSPSLPPIGRNKIRDEQPHRSHGQITTDEDTSGYLSDSRNSPDIWKSSERHRSNFSGKPSTSSLSSYTLSHKTNADMDDDNNSHKTTYPYDRNRHHHQQQQQQQPQLKQMQHLDNNYLDNRKRQLDLNNQQYAMAYNRANAMRLKEYANNRKVLACNRSALENVNSAAAVGASTGQGRKYPLDGLDDNEHETDFNAPKTPSSISSDGSRDYSLLSSYPDVGARKEKEERAKWGDRGVTVGHFYDPISKDGPGWLEKSSYDSEDESVRSYSFIRGQNAPIDSNTLAERASRRLKAVEFQNAIKEQLKEREKSKRMEAEKRAMEERVQEERIHKQMAIEQERVAEEQRKQLEKIELERKRSQMMVDAIEKAKQAAQMEKARKKQNVVLNSTEEENRPPQTAHSLLENAVDDLIVLNHKDDGSDASILHENSVVDDKSLPATPVPAATTPSSTIDDGEKILIGSPIRMRKKAVQKQQVEEADADAKASSEPAKEAHGKGNDLEGIALVLQGIPPIVPMLNNDLATLNQNLSTMNNLQIAVMLAHQMHYFNPLAMNTMTPPALADRYTRSPPTTPQSFSVGAQSNLIPSPCNSYAERYPLASPDTAMADANSVVKQICKICDKKCKESGTPSSHEDSVSSATHDREFSHNSTRTRRDTGTETIDSDVSPPSTAPSKVDDDSSIRSLPSTPMSTSTVDAQTQTDGKADQLTCCCQQNHQCHHHHIYVKEFPGSCSPFHTKSGREKIQAIAMDIVANQKKQLLLGEHAVTAAMICTKPASNQLRIEAKEHKEPVKMRDRPKWGVNRPLNQYVKASERDPIYQRNRRKKYRKYASDEIDANTEMTRSLSPSTISTSTATANDTPMKRKPIDRISRNICTEILPIKTDVNGRVYLNFDEMSTTLSEDEVRKKLHSQHSNIERIMRRRRTSDDLLRDAMSADDANGNKVGRDCRSGRNNADVDLESA